MKKSLKDYFIPHEGNSYKPHSLQKAAMMGMVAMVLLSFTVINLHSIFWISSDWLVSTVLPAVIVNLTNVERAEGSLGNLRRNSILDNAATLKAQHMAENQYFSHFSPEGISPWYWFEVTEYNFVNAGENLAIHFTDSGDVVKAWMESPTHRANIMNGVYTEIGVGTAEGVYEGFPTIYVVQLFGTPAASLAQVEPAPIPAQAEPEPLVASETTSVEEDETVVLAEAVAITEQVEIVEPKPILTETSTGPVATNTEVVDMTVTESGVAMYSDHLSTSTGGVPASIDDSPVAESNSPSPLAELATQPHLVLQVLYLIIGLFVLGSLLLSILIEIRHQEPLQIAYSVALLLLMYGLYQLQTYITGGALIV